MESVPLGLLRIWWDLQYDPSYICCFFGLLKECHSYQIPLYPVDLYQDFLPYQVSQVASCKLLQSYTQQELQESVCLQSHLHTQNGARPNLVCKCAQVPLSALCKQFLPSDQISHHQSKFKYVEIERPFTFTSCNNWHPNAWKCLGLLVNIPRLNHLITFPNLSSQPP